MHSFHLLPCVARNSISVSKKGFGTVPRWPPFIWAAARHKIYPPQSSIRTVLRSAQACIRDDLKSSPIEKWGWVIYRCTYTDDATLGRFRSRVEERTRRTIAQSDAPEIDDRLEWTWVEDAHSLDGASTAVLRERFRAWVADEVARQPGDYDPDVVPRFRYFIKIDEEALRSVTDSLASKTSWIEGQAFVKFVDGNWEPELAGAAEGQQNQKLEDCGSWEEEALEPIEGCIEEDVGWICIMPHMIGADFYDAMSGDQNFWHTFYERPPSLVCY